MNKNEPEVFFILNTLANILQIFNYDMNVREISNDELMKMLELQNREYLDLIKKDIETIKKSIVKEEEKHNES